MCNRAARACAAIEPIDPLAAMRHVKVTELKPHEKPSPSLRAWASLELPAIGIKLNRVAVHRTKTRDFVAMPALQVWTGASNVWIPCLEFTDGAAYAEFQRAALAAIRTHEAAMGVEE